jgi:hypothetical protein
MAMRVEERPARVSGTRALQELKDGFKYVTRFAPVRDSLLLLALVATMGMPYTVLMPAIAATVLHGGPHTLGYLMTSTGVGAPSRAPSISHRGLQCSASVARSWSPRSRSDPPC